jgi:hypothetical protein
MVKAPTPVARDVDDDAAPVLDPDEDEDEVDDDVDAVEEDDVEEAGAEAVLDDPPEH